MSLAEQIQRVDGGQNDTLKAILTALGVTVGTQKIDQLAALAATISPKLKPDNLNSAETNALFGLGADAVPDEVLAKISEMFGAVNDSLDSQPKIAYAKTTGKSITLPFEPGYVVASVGATDDYNWTDAKIVAQGESVAYKTGMNAYIRLNGKVVTSGGSQAIANLKAVAFLVP